MDWISDLKETSAKAAARAILPAVYLPALLFYGGLSMVMAVTAFRVAGRILVTGQIPTNAGALPLLAIATLVLMPAITSGLLAVSGKVVLTDKAGWRDFWSGMGIYYWRVVGLSVLAALAIVFVAALFGWSRSGNYSLSEIPVSAPIPVLLIYMAGRYFAAPVVPAMVLGENQAFPAIGLGVTFARRNAAVLIPAVGVDIVLAWILQNLHSAVLDTSIHGFRFGPGRLFAYAAVVALAMLVSTFFRLLYMGLYHSRQTLAPAPGAPIEADKIQEPQEPQEQQEHQQPQESQQNPLKPE